MTVKCDYPECGRAMTRCGVCDYDNRTLPAEPNVTEDWLECYEFYQLMQDYRHVNQYAMHPLGEIATVNAYERVKSYLRNRLRPLEPSGQTKAVPQEISGIGRSDLSTVSPPAGTAPSGGMPDYPQQWSLDTLDGTMERKDGGDYIFYEDYDTLRRHAEQLALEIGELRETFRKATGYTVAEYKTMVNEVKNER